MITVLAGTNRRGSNTLKVASLGMKHFQSREVEAQLLDLAKLPPGIFAPEHYWNTTPGFRPFQEMILNTDDSDITDEDLKRRFEKMLDGFAGFSRRLKAA